MLSIALNIKDRPVTIVGGGSVALRKLKTLISEGAKLRIISKNFLDDFYKYDCELIKDEYKKEYIEASLLLYIATDDASLNEKIEKDAKQMHILFNRCDKSDGSDFISINMKKVGGLDIAISTAGRLPDLNKTIMDDLKKYDSYDDEYLDLASKLRSHYIDHHKQDEIKKIKTYTKEEILNYIKEFENFEIKGRNEDE